MMVIFVIPRLAEIIHELGQELPLVTRLVIGFSGALSSLWYLFLIGGVGGFIGLRQFGKTPRGREAIDRFKLHLPIYGEIIKKIILVRMVNTLSTLVSGGVSISQSLEITGDVASNTIYRAIVLEALEAVKRGETLSSVFMKKEEIPPMVTQMIVVGEKSGNLSHMLQKTGAFYQSEVERTVANISELIAPLLLIVLGGGVGILVAAILVPMYGVLLEGA
jgi:type IV pilus assembly protein PilC